MTCGEQVAWLDAMQSISMAMGGGPLAVLGRSCNRGDWKPEYDGEKLHVSRPHCALLEKSKAYLHASAQTCKSHEFVGWTAAKWASRCIALMSSFTQRMSVKRMATPREGGRGAGRALVVAPDRSTTQAASRLDALLAAAQSNSASRVSTQARPPDVPLRVVASQATALRAWEAPDDELVESELPLARREQLQERASRVQLCAALTREAAAQYHDEEQRRERERQDRQAVKLQEEQARKRAHVSSHREARLAAERAQIEADRRREQEHKAALREQLTTARARRAEAERQAAERQAQALAREAALNERAARERRAAAKAAEAAMAQRRALEEEERRTQQQAAADAAALAAAAEEATREQTRQRRERWLER